VKTSNAHHTTHHVHTPIAIAQPRLYPILGTPRRRVFISTDELQMKKLLAAVVCFSIVALAASQGGDKKAPKVDGIWHGVSAVINGKKIPDEEFAKIMLVVVIKDGKYTVTAEGNEIESGTFKTDDSQKPAHLTLTIAKGKDEGKAQLGIYKVDDDKLTVAFGTPGGKVRPKDYEGGEGFEVHVLKRKK